MTCPDLASVSGGSGPHPDCPGLVTGRDITMTTTQAIFLRNIHVSGRLRPEAPRPCHPTHTHPVTHSHTNRRHAASPPPPNLLPSGQSQGAVSPASIFILLRGSEGKAWPVVRDYRVTSHWASLPALWWQDGKRPGS